MRFTTTMFLLMIAVCSFAYFDEESGKIKGEAWRSGVPLGGLGCGKLELCTDGWLGNYTGNNNWDRPTGRIKGAFFALYAESGDKKVARMLRLKSSNEYEGVENIEDLDYYGWFPTAKLNYFDKSLPVEIEMFAWSPLIPHNAADSSLPAASFSFSIKNSAKSSAKAVLLFSWPNIAGFGGREETPWDHLSNNDQKPFSSRVVTGVLYDKPNWPPKNWDEDFLWLNSHYDHRNVKGNYFLGIKNGSASVRLIRNYDADSTELPFWKSFSQTGIAACNEPESVAQPAAALAAEIELKPGESRSIDFVLVWYFPNLVATFQKDTTPGPPKISAANTQYMFDGDLETGWSSLLNIKQDERIVINLANEYEISKIIQNSRGSGNNYLRAFSIELSADGQNWFKVFKANEDHVKALVEKEAIPASFEPHKARYIRITNNSSRNRKWVIKELEVYDASGNRIPSDSFTAEAHYKTFANSPIVTNYKKYFEYRFRDPHAIAEFILMEKNRLLAETLEWQELVRMSNLPNWLKLKLVNCLFPLYANSIFDREGTFTVLESPTNMHGALGTMDQRMASHGFYTQMFPEQDAAELRLFAKCQDLVEPKADGRIPHFSGNVHQVIGNPNVHYGVTDWPDLSCSFVMQVLKYYRWTEDKKFLDEMWPHVKRAMEWLDSADSDGDEIPEGGSTYDYEPMPLGAFIYNASCYLSALRAASDLAIIQNSPALKRKYNNKFNRVQKSVMENLWNGAFFIKMVKKNGEKIPNSFIAQLAGDWLARLCASGSIFDPEVADSTMREILRRHVHAFSPVPPMEVTPDGTLTTKACFILQHEPYVGCEAINLGYTDDGLDVIRRVFEVGWSLNKNPWRQSLAARAPEGVMGGLTCYMTNPTTWHVFNALSGTTLDLPQKTLYISPKIGKTIPELHIPIFFSRFWLWMDYNPGKNILKLKVLKTFGAPVVIDKVASEVESAAIKLDNPFVVAEGATLDLSKHIKKLVIYPEPRFVK